MKSNPLLYAAIVVTTAISITSCQLKQATSKDPLVDNRDTTVNVGNDFFNYANGGWFKGHPIPASESVNGIFLMVQDSVNNVVKGICETDAQNSNASKGSNEQKIGDFFYSGMDTASIEKNGLKPLATEFQLIAAIKSSTDLLASIAHLHTIGVGPLFAFGVNKDDKNSSKYLAILWQGGLGLPDRDYYFNNDARTANIRKEYLNHVARMFVLMGDNEVTAKANSTSVMQMETALAKASRKIEDLRDPYKNYHKMPVVEVNKLTPSINWSVMGAGMGLPNLDSINIGQPEFMKEVENQVKNTSIDNWKTYLRWNLINTYAAYLNKAIDKQNFYFYNAILSGAKEQKPLWKRVVEQTNGSLGELIGQEYVAKYLPKNTKDKLVEIGKNVMDVFAEHIKALDWMSAVTKEKALSKLSKVVVKMGYPDKWKDYSKMDIDRNAYVLNVMRANEWAYNQMINHWGKPVDRTEWSMTPQTYNAYYDPTNNEIVIPACNIIVPGFEKGNLPDDAILYGIIGGSTIGHEITHGFDDQGRLYDEKGNLKNWWTKEDSLKFSDRTKKLVAQYSAYTVLDSLHIRGEATLGENIADLGGAIMGYEAFKRTEQAKKGEKINGFTPDQRYFLAFAYSWMVQRRNESVARQIMTDVHSPAQYRVNGPLSNSADFYQAFNIKAGQSMFRADDVRVKIW
jgi:putative endopeptidase